MKKPEQHFLICNSFRVSGEPQGICNRKGAIDLVQYLEDELGERGFDNFAISTTGCLKMCDKGPVMVVYPAGDWYGNMSEEGIDAVLDALENGGRAEEYLIS